MKQVLLILALALLASAVPKLGTLEFRHLHKSKDGSFHKPGSRIIGGSDVIPHSIPYQVFLTFYPDSEPEDAGSCGGTLISANYVLTAGHCGYQVNEAHITLGAHDLSKDEDTTVKLISRKIYVHENYTKSRIFDVATVKLPRTITFTNAIRPVTLPKRSDASNFFENVYARVSGWGSTSPDSDLTNTLKYADVKILRNRLCEGYFHTIIHPNIICTSPEEGSVACSGDSGGPLAINGVQIGIVSFGSENCIHYPTGYLRLTSILDWIQANSDVVIQD